MVPEIKSAKRVVFIFHRLSLQRFISQLVLIGPSIPNRAKVEVIRRAINRKGKCHKYIV